MISPRALLVVLGVTMALGLSACASAEGGDARATDSLAGTQVVSTVPVLPAATSTSAPALAPTATPAHAGRVTINAVGDLMLARDIIDLMDSGGPVYPFASVRPILADADLTIANMEGTFTERGSQADKFYTFRTPPHDARGLADAGIDLVSLANNHAMDFGADGLADTLAALDAAGVKHAGAGMTEQAARAAVFLEVNGLKLAFLSYNSVLEATFARGASAGVAFAEAGSVQADVAAARQQADVVIVAFHGGVEYTDNPTGAQKSLYRAAIDAGAAVVLGTHPHVLQGWERYKGGFIVYSLGNFVFDLDRDDLGTLGPRPFQTLVLRLELDKTGVVDATYRPVFIDPDENRPRPATAEEKAAIDQRVEMLKGLLP